MCSPVGGRTCQYKYSWLKDSSHVLLHTHLVESRANGLVTAKGNFGISYGLLHRTSRYKWRTCQLWMSGCAHMQTSHTLATSDCGNSLKCIFTNRPEPLLRRWNRQHLIVLFHQGTLSVCQFQCTYDHLAWMRPAKKTTKPGTVTIQQGQCFHQFPYLSALSPVSRRCYSNWCCRCRRQLWRWGPRCRQWRHRPRGHVYLAGLASRIVDGIEQVLWVEGENVRCLEHASTVLVCD